MNLFEALPEEDERRFGEELGATGRSAARSFSSS